MCWGGKPPVLQRAEREELGINLVMAPGDLQRAAMHAMRQAADAILRDGHTESLSDVMATFDDREVAINSAKYMALDEKYAV